LCILEPVRAANATRDELEIAPFDFERQGPPSQIQFDQTVFYLPGEVFQEPFHVVPIHKITLEGDLLPDRLAFPRGFDGTIILATYKAIELAPLLPKQGTQTPLVQAFEIGPVCYPQLPELTRGDLAYTKEFIDRY